MDCEFLRDRQPDFQEIPSPEPDQVAFRPALRYFQLSQSPEHEPEGPGVAC